MVYTTLHQNYLIRHRSFTIKVSNFVFIKPSYTIFHKIRSTPHVRQNKRVATLIMNHKRAANRIANVDKAIVPIAIYL